MRENELASKGEVRGELIGNMWNSGGKPNTRDAKPASRGHPKKKRGTKIKAWYGKNKNRRLIIELPDTYKKPQKSQGETERRKRQINSRRRENHAVNEMSSQSRGREIPKKLAAQSETMCFSIPAAMT